MEPCPDKDTLLSAVGNFGRCQLQNFLVVSAVGIPVAWHMLVIFFFAAPSDFWCARPPAFSNWTVQDWRNISSPIIEVGGKKQYDQCHRYEMTYTRLPVNGSQQEVWSVHINTSQLVSCVSWEYDQPEVESTIIKQWDLVCDNAWLTKISQSLYMFGVLVGNLAFGILIDKYGRKRMLVLSTVLSLISQALTVCSPWFIMFVVTRWLVAVATTGLFTAGFVYCMEWVGGKWRTIVGITIEIPWTLGYCLLAGFGYAVKDWRHLQILISLPTILLLSYHWIIPESPRWLLVTGKIKEATYVIQDAAKKNGRLFPDGFQLKSPETAEVTQQDRTMLVLDVFRYPNLRKRSLNLCFNFFVNSLVYYGLSLNTGNLGGNLYINFFISGAVEVPALVISLIVMLRMGRRWPLSIAMVLAGGACLSILAVPTGVYPHEWPRVTLAMIGKFGVSSSFFIVYMYATEVYPTVVRSVGLGLCSTCARIGSMVAPLVGTLDIYGPHVPICIFGLFSLAAGLLVLFLPETSKYHLTDTIEEAENCEKKPIY